jgi:hypothetical protein
MAERHGIGARGAGRFLRLACLAVGMAALLMPRTAPAIIGHYTAGVPNVHDFFVAPEPGLFFAMYTYFYQTDSFRDRNGNPVDHLIVPPRRRPPRTLPLDVNLNQVALSPAILWVPDFTLLGARYGAYIAPSAANANVSAAVETINKGKQFETGWGFADIFVQPLWLQWSLWRLDLVAAYGFYAPTGRFSRGAADNIGLGFWTQQFQTAGQFNFDEARTFSLIMVETWEINSRVQGRDLRPGPRLSLNWAIDKIWLAGMLETAVLGYDQWQVGFDSGPDQSRLLAGVLDSVHAAGVQIGIPNWGIALKYLHEFEARQRFQGQMVTFTFGLPLDPIVDKVGALFE